MTAPSLDALAAAARGMLDAATPGPWDAGALNVYATAGCPRHAPGGDPHDPWPCVCRVVVNSAIDADRPLIAASWSLARALVAAVDALRAEREARAAAERERATYRADAHRLAAANGRLVDEADAAQRGRRAAETARDALAAAVREERAAHADYDAAGAAFDGRPNPARREMERVANAALVAKIAATDALLSGAPADVVRAGVVRDFLRAVDALATTRADDTTPEMRGNAVATRTALDAALAAAEGR